MSKECHKTTHKALSGTYSGSTGYSLQQMELLEPKEMDASSEWSQVNLKHNWAKYFNSVPNILLLNFPHCTKMVNLEYVEFQRKIHVNQITTALHCLPVLGSKFKSPLSQEISWMTLGKSLFLSFIYTTDLLWEDKGRNYVHHPELFERRAVKKYYCVIWL